MFPSGTWCEFAFAELSTRHRTHSETTISYDIFISFSSWILNAWNELTTFAMNDIDDLDIVAMEMLVIVKYCNDNTERVDLRRLWANCTVEVPKAPLIVLCAWAQWADNWIIETHDEAALWTEYRWKLNDCSKPSEGNERNASFCISYKPFRFGCSMATDIK